MLKKLKLFYLFCINLIRKSDSANFASRMYLCIYVNCSAQQTDLHIKGKMNINLSSWWQILTMTTIKTLPDEVCKIFYKLFVWTCLLQLLWHINKHFFLIFRWIIWIRICEPCLENSLSRIYNQNYWFARSWKGLQNDSKASLHLNRDNLGHD